MKIEKTAYGAGTREYENFPNVLRLILGEIEPQGRGDAELEKSKDQKQKTNDR